MNKSMRKLTTHRFVDEVESEGMEEGRFFVHLKPGRLWRRHKTVGRSFSSAVTALRALNKETVKL